MGLFDDANRKYDLRKEKEKENQEREALRTAKLIQAERQLINKFSSYLPKMSSELYQKKFDTTINQTDLHPWIIVKDYPISKWVKLMYKQSDSNEKNGIVTASISSSKSDEVVCIEYIVDEKERVRMSDGTDFILEDEVVKHYEAILDKL
ncbi:hypothetical protein [Macrococcoides caseolyticum]|uniref:Uncharacterized protein n=1 Tax=Macrococcoides caseolyticum TaxID=69966 RepID=A0A855GPC6_9STAP|nr:hypothetical protein [Macrococcus caseolyticus]PKE26156.1 hypothetical protein CW686_06510 [Macrococcus caseolyticus]PKE45345.1 hypothetical protein CW666_02020 [Macrococcus caseolyticus]PKE58670.1 hypothetical protein CW673_06630 [Macrococcus caseolyticus]